MALTFGAISVSNYSISRCLPILRNLISHIVIVGSKKKMVRIYARRVIAFMKNEKTIGYGADV